MYGTCCLRIHKTTKRIKIGKMHKNKHKRQKISSFICKILGPIISLNFMLATVVMQCNRFTLSAVCVIKLNGGFMVFQFINLLVVRFCYRAIYSYSIDGTRQLHAYCNAVYHQLIINLQFARQRNN